MSQKETLRRLVEELMPSPTGAGRKRKLANYDPEHEAATQAIAHPLLRGDWVEVGSRLLDAEEARGEPFDYGLVAAGLYALGFRTKIQTARLRWMRETVAVFRMMRLRRDNLLGVSLHFAKQVADWYEEGELSPQEARELLAYRPSSARSAATRS